MPLQLWCLTQWLGNRGLAVGLYVDTEVEIPKEIGRCLCRHSSHLWSASQIT